MSTCSPADPPLGPELRGGYESSARRGSASERGVDEAAVGSGRGRAFPTLEALRAKDLNGAPLGRGSPR